MGEFRFPPLNVTKIAWDKIHAPVPPEQAALDRLASEASASCNPKIAVLTAQGFAPPPRHEDGRLTEVGPAPRGPRGPTGPDDKAPLCLPFPLHSSTTNWRVLYLREIGGPGCLKKFLDQVIAQNNKLNSNPPAGCTLVIDQPVNLTGPITIPRNFVLSGTGIHSGGILVVPASVNLNGGAVIRFQGGGSSVIRDIAVEAAFPNASGFEVSQPGSFGHIYFDQVRIANFSKFSITAAKDAFSIFIHRCQFVGGGGTHIQIGPGSNTWRIRDCTIRDATNWGGRSSWPE